MEPTTTLAAKREVLDVLVEARMVEYQAQIRQLQLALRWALMHPAHDGAAYAGWGDAGLTFDGEPVGPAPLAGTGAPLVAAAAPIELAAALDRSVDHAQQLLADVLELAFRLPRLWEHACEGRIAVWRARAISRTTHDLTLDAALHADRLLCAVPAQLNRLSAAGAERLVHEARLFADPDRAHAEEDEALARRGVWLRRGGNAPGVTDVHMTLDSLDAEAFDDAVAHVAADLKGLGDTDTLDVRRAKAVGVLADPQHALDLLAGRDTDPRPSSSVDLVVHVTPEPDVVSVESLGALSADLFAGWLSRLAVDGVKVRLRPVIDLAADPVTAVYVPPADMREQVLLRDATCAFPGCPRDSRRCDLDHVVAYDSGGQTRPSNLAPLCRRHHRAKTHQGWTYQRLANGSYAWTSPTGRSHTTIPFSRAPLGSRRP